MATIVCFFQNCFRVEGDDSPQQSIAGFQAAPMSPPSFDSERQERYDRDGTDENNLSLQLSDDQDSTFTPDATPRNSMTSSDEGFGYMLRKVFQGIDNGLFQEDATTTKFEKVAEAKKVVGFHQSPLRTATVYKSFGDIPSIALQEVVMPGSLLQRQMSIRLQDKGVLSEANVDECVICMDTFDESNPRMPTLCGCGENKTFFHLPCLYQWVDKCSDCPSCRVHLNWQEL